jgi:hypothetical protein
MIVMCSFALNGYLNQVAENECAQSKRKRVGARGFLTAH